EGGHFRKSSDFLRAEERRSPRRRLPNRPLPKPPLLGALAFFNSGRAADSLQALRIAGPCAGGPSKVSIEVHPGEFRPAPQAGAEARQSLRRLHPIAPELLRERLRRSA